MDNIELGIVISFEKGKKPIALATEPQEGYLPYVDIEAFETGTVKKYTSGEKCLACEDGDILIVCDGSHSGLVVYAIHCFVGSTLAKISCEVLLNQYLFYFLQGKYRLFNTSKKGTGTPHLNPTLLRQQKIVVPSIEEQQRIVTRIEELFSELDSAVETLQKTKQQLEVYRQAVLKEAFAECQSTVKVNDVCKHVTDGDHMPPPKAETGIPFIMISNIDKNVINWNGTAFVNREYYENINDKRRPQKGDVLYTVTGSFGITVLVDFDREFCFQRHIALLRPNNRIIQKYLYYVMQEPEVYQQAEKKSTGTAQKTVSLSVLRNIEIPFVESVKEQERIVEKIESQLSVCDGIEKTIEESLQQAEAMRQSILKKAFECNL